MAEENDNILFHKLEVAASIVLRLSTSPRTTYRSRRLFLKVTSHSFCRSSFPNRTRFAGLRFAFGCKLGNCGFYTVGMLQLVVSDNRLRRAFFFSRSPHHVQMGLAFLKQQMYNVSKINTGELVVQAERKSSNFDPLT